jgi:hypothetical protein
MLAPQSGQTRLRIAEIKLELVFVAKATDAIMSLLLWQLLPPNSQSLKRGPQEPLKGAGTG